MSPLPELIEEDISEVERAMQELLLKSDANVSLLLDKGGFLITKCGNYQKFDTVTLAALAAASFAATQGIASLVCENNFSSVYQQGEENSMLVLNVDDNCLLTVVFGANISVGAVKYFAGTTVKSIAKQMKRARTRAPQAGIDLSLLNLADPASVFRKKRA
jgi:predicted regulator of Ras-like GTPase activity (Roadblock/LC7/MglB family)